jgi:hypothetical protein
VRLRWPWQRQRREPLPGEAAKRLADARQAEVRSRWAWVERRREIEGERRERNGFGEAMLTLFRGEG